MIRLYELAARDEAIRFSPYAWRVRLALLHKGLPFEGIAWHLVDKAAIAPAKSMTVPVISADDYWLRDSFDICLYLDKEYSEKPLFNDITMARFYNGWLTKTVVHGLFPMIAADIWSILSEEDQVYFRKSREKYLGCSLEEAREKREQTTPEFLASLSPVRDMLTTSGSQFLSGDQAGWSDYALAGNFIWARTVSDYEVLDDDMILTEWFERMLDLFDGHARKAPTVHDWD